MAYDRERFPVCSSIEGTCSVTSEEERVEPGGLRFSLFIMWRGSRLTLLNI